MWQVTTNAIEWELFPDEVLALIRAKVDELAAAGFTDPAYIQNPTRLPDGKEQRHRNFTTLASAQDYADFMNELPSGLVDVVSVGEIV